MEWSDVLDPDLEPREVICEKVPAFHKHRLEQFRSFVKTSLIFSLEFEDSGEKFTLELGPDGAQAEPHEMIDFPQATVRGGADRWHRSVELARRLAEPADEQITRHQGRICITEELKIGFEAFDGVLEVEVVELPDDDEPLCFDVILNDYQEPAGARRAQLTVRWPVLERLANGSVDPVEAARSITVRGAMGLAFDIGGFLMKELEL